MTDRINAFLVVLDEELREDDAENTITALKQIKGVIGVEKAVENSSLMIAKMQIRNEMTAKLLEVLYPKED